MAIITQLTRGRNRNQRFLDISSPCLFALTPPRSHTARPARHQQKRSFQSLGRADPVAVDGSIESGAARTALRVDWRVVAEYENAKPRRALH